MKRLLALLFTLPIINASAAHTEFYCHPHASNLNAGSTTNEAAIFTFTGGNFTNTTGWFHASGADLSAITTQMWASVYTDGASVGVFVGMITNVDDTLDNIGVSGEAKSGTKPTDGTGNRTIKIGGAWKGPNAASGYPFNQATLAQMTNMAGDTPRINFKGISGTNFSVTAAMTHTRIGPTIFRGYTATPGDGGQATIDGGASGASYIVLSVSGNGGLVFEDLIFATNGASGSAAGVSATSLQTTFRRCVFRDMLGAGINLAGTTLLVECEAFGNNTSGTTKLGGFTVGSGYNTFIRCISHDNTPALASGYAISASAGSLATFFGCIADSNGKDGFEVVDTSDTQISITMSGCDSYNNATNGIYLSTASNDESSFYLENCNFVKNGAYGIHINGETNKIHSGHIVNCGFGSGTQTNGFGSINATNGLDVISFTLYAANTAPWLDPANGDFRINLSTAQGDGRGTFLQTSGGSGTLGFPDIGAAQHTDVGGAAVGTTFLFVQ